MTFDIPFDAVAKAAGLTMTDDWNCLQCDAQMSNGELDPKGDAECDHSDREIVSPCCGKPVDPDIRRCACGAGV